MNEKNNMKEYLITNSEDRNKLFPNSRQLCLEDNSNNDSVKNSLIFSEYDDDIKSEKDFNLNINRNNNNNIKINVNRIPSKSYSHKAVNTLTGFKFRKSKNYEDDEGKSRESYSTTYHKVINFSKRTETHYILYTCNLLSFSINYEAIWRFPYYFISAEGAVFFIPFIIFYFLFGIPVLTLESSLGQIFKSWPMDYNYNYNMKKEHRYNFSIMTIKILTLGEHGVGKSCIIIRYIADKFDNKTLCCII